MSYDPKQPRDPHSGEWAHGPGGGLDVARRHLDELPGLLGVHGQIQSPADHRLAVSASNIKDELADGPDAADWEFIRGEMVKLAAARQAADKRGEAGDSHARALAAKLGDLLGALEALQKPGQGVSRTVAHEAFVSRTRELCHAVGMRP